MIAIVLVLAGFAFKVSAAPFHNWAPDVYQGAPTPAAAFLSVGPKIAGFAAILKFFTMILGSQDGDLGAADDRPLHGHHDRRRHHGAGTA